LKFLLSFILITQHKTVSYVKLSNSAIGKNIFFIFFQTLARFGHPKVENLVQDNVFFQIKITQMRVFFQMEYQKYMNIINLQKYRCQVLRIFLQKFLKFCKKIHFYMKFDI
jgi:hypothetical protein